MTSTSAPRTARERARAELTREITAAARRQLAEVGASALSLRAVARELGMVSSAVYRYFPSRDDLLTVLIIDAYDAVGAAAEAADAACRRSDFEGRWMAACRAVRTWARENPHEYALVYGSPVPGYRAPEDTIGPASRITSVLLAILRDAAAAGVMPADDGVALPRRVRAELSSIRRSLVPDVPEKALARGIMAWTQLFGAISFELFGHLHNVIDDHDAWFEHEMARMAAFLRLTG